MQHRRLLIVFFVWFFITALYYYDAAANIRMSASAHSLACLRFEYRISVDNRMSLPTARLVRARLVRQVATISEHYVGYWDEWMVNSRPQWYVPAVVKLNACGRFGSLTRSAKSHCKSRLGSLPRSVATDGAQPVSLQRLAASGRPTH